MYPLLTYMRRNAFRMSGYIAQLPPQTAESRAATRAIAPPRSAAAYQRTPTPCARDWLAVRAIGHTRPALRFSAPLYLPHQTAAASRVSFWPPCPWTLISHQEKLAFNEARWQSIPDDNIVIISDASVIRDDNDNNAAYAFKMCRKRDIDVPNAFVAKALGADHISFGAEAYGIRDALRLLPTIFPHRSLHENIYIVGDPWSVFSSLDARGAVHARDTLMHEIWLELLHIQSPIICAFVYAHCGFEVHDRVDVVANLTARTQQPPAGTTDFPIALHLASALSSQDARDAIENLFDELPLSSIRRRFAPEDACGWDPEEPRLRTGPSHIFDDIARLRMGVSPLARGYHHEVIDQCRACPTTVMRGRIGPNSANPLNPCNPVEHFLACPNLAIYRHQAFDSPDALTPIVLWDQRIEKYIRLVRQAFPGR
jgi:hypothetical protein